MYVVFDCDTLLQAMTESEKGSKIHTHSVNMSTKNSEVLFAVFLALNHIDSVLVAWRIITRRYRLASSRRTLVNLWDLFMLRGLGSALGLQLVHTKTVSVVFSMQKKNINIAAK